LRNDDRPPADEHGGCHLAFYNYINCYSGNYRCTDRDFNTTTYGHAAADSHTHSRAD
jgi:hypothetical protein